MRVENLRRAAVLTLAGAVSGVMAPGIVTAEEGNPIYQGSEPNPIANQESSDEQIPESSGEKEFQLNQIEIEQIKDILGLFINPDAEPIFFETLKERLDNNPNNFFKFTKIDDGFRYDYYPDGVDNSDSPRIIHSLSSGINSDGANTSTFLNSRFKMKIGKEGTLESEASYFHYMEAPVAKNILLRYFSIPFEIDDYPYYEVGSRASNWKNKSNLKNGSKVFDMESSVGFRANGVLFFNSLITVSPVPDLGSTDIVNADIPVEQNLA